MPRKVQRTMQARSRLCERLEMLESTMAAASQQALATLDARHDKVLRERFELASRALGGADQARQTLLDSLLKNLEKRLELCLQVEIAAGIDSPAEFTQARMQFQVSRLADAVHHKNEETRSRHDQLRELQMKWYQAGPAPMEAQGSLEARFERAIAAPGSDPAA